MKSRTDKNSTTAAVAGFQGSMGSVPLPEGITLRSDEEHVIWGQFTRARARGDWRDMDLLLLAKVVRMEADIRAQQRARCLRHHPWKTDAERQFPIRLLSGD